MLAFSVSYILNVQNTAESILNSDNKLIIEKIKLMIVFI